MDLQIPNDAPARSAFGQRRLRPRACVIDIKEHIRTVLEDALEISASSPANARAPASSRWCSRCIIPISS